MPDDVPWPTSQSTHNPDLGIRPLHFVMQIDCAALPADLWGGLGPRTGWLLFFIDPNEGVPDGPENLHVLHTSAKGPPRDVPGDMPPVHDGEYTGPDYRHCGDSSNLPTTWRYWPLDIVPVSNTPNAAACAIADEPTEMSGFLYPFEPVMDERHWPTLQPFTHAMARHALQAIDHAPRYSIRPPQNLSDEEHARLALADTRDQLITTATKACDTWVSRLNALRAETPADEVNATQIKGWLNEQTRALRLLNATESPQRLIDAVSTAKTRYEEWWAGARHRLHTRIETLGSGDEPLAPGDWQAIQREMEADAFEWLEIKWSDTSQPKVAGKRISVFDRFDPKGAGLREIVARYYTDPDLNPLLPDAVRQEHEAWSRRITSNRPHRMGGYEEGLQHEATEGPRSSLLLLQLASDYAMHWVWGDVGTYYFWIALTDLERHDFSRVEMQFDCH